jgi:hypothetical protein
MSDCESLRDAIFFQVLKRRFRKQWMIATKSNMLVCVPQSRSLSGRALVEADIGARAFFFLSLLDDPCRSQACREAVLPFVSLSVSRSIF